MRKFHFPVKHSIISIWLIHNRRMQHHIFANFLLRVPFQSVRAKKNLFWKFSERNLIREITYINKPFPHISCPIYRRYRSCQEVMTLAYGASRLWRIAGRRFLPEMLRCRSVALHERIIDRWRALSWRRDKTASSIAQLVTRRCGGVALWRKGFGILFGFGLISGLGYILFW